MLQFFIPMLFAPTPGNAADKPIRPFRFVEAKTFKEAGGLPPKLEVTFDVMCNEEFVKVIRHEWTDLKTMKTTIAVGGLVRENLLSSCAGVKKEIHVEAGDTYSGREYEISKIR